MTRWLQVIFFMVTACLGGQVLQYSMGMSCYMEHAEREILVNEIRKSDSLVIGFSAVSLSDSGDTIASIVESQENVLNGNDFNIYFATNYFFADTIGQVVDRFEDSNINVNGTLIRVLKMHWGDGPFFGKSIVVAYGDYSIPLIFERIDDSPKGCGFYYHLTKYRSTSIPQKTVETAKGAINKSYITAIHSIDKRNLRIKSNSKGNSYDASGKSTNMNISRLRASFPFIH